MKVLFNSNILLAILILTLTLSACDKNADTEPTPPPPAGYELSYGDSILYLNGNGSDQIVMPSVAKAGTYSGFPEGIEIDEKTGAINVSKSETGLRYRITHTDNNGKVSEIMLVISGITFTDRYYHLSQNDSIAFPIYNASAQRALPLSGSNFDDGNGANSSGCSVRTINGQINLAETIRNGVFGSTPQNDAKEEFDILYRLNDKSNKAVNKVRVKLYYYKNMSDVPDDLLETLKDRTDQGVFLKGALTSKTAKPRPPCVIIIAN